VHAINGPARSSPIERGAMMAEVVVRLDGGQEAVSAITASLVARLKLERGSRVSIVV